MRSKQDNLATSDLAIQSILKDVQSKHLAAPDWQAEMQNFIPMRGSWHANSEHSFTLDSEIANFLVNDKKVLLLIGDSGCGKSLYTEGLSVDLWQEYSYDKPIPIWISLPGLKNPISNAIPETLASYGFTPTQITHLQATASFIFILDAYDEVKNLKNLYVSNNLAAWQAKTIITCRREYLYHIDNYKSFFVPFNGERALYSACTEIVINLFNSQQIQDYIQAYTCKQNMDEQNMDEQNILFYQQSITELAGLKKLITTPFMLKLALEALPRIVDKFKPKGKTNVIANKKLTQAALYDVFVTQWFERQEQKLKNSGHIAQDEDIKPEFWQYAKELAKTMHQQGVTQIYYFGDESDLFTETNDISLWQKFFNRDNPRIELLRSACLIREVSTHNYTFVHSSLAEYFFTRNLYEDLSNKSTPANTDHEQQDITTTTSLSAPYLSYANLSENELTTTSTTTLAASNTIKQELPQEANDYFNQKLIVNETTNIQFLADRITEDVNFKQSLFAKIYASKNNPDASIAAANAITILNRAKISFANMDFTGICINSANMQSAVLHRTNLKNADLRKINFQSAWLQATNFTGANLIGADFAESPFLKLEKDISDICYSNNGKYLAACSSNTAYIFNHSTWEIRKKFTAVSAIKNIALSPNGKFLAVACNDSPFAYLWNLNKNVMERFDGDSELSEKERASMFYHVKYSPNGKLLARTFAAQIYFWNAKTNILLRILDITALNINKRRYADVFVSLGAHDIRSINFSPNSKYFATIDAGGMLYIWNVNTWKFKQQIQAHKGIATSMTFSPSGKFLATCGSDHKICLWEFATGQKIREFSAEDIGFMFSVVFSPDERWLISGSDNKMLMIWNIESEDCYNRVKGSASSIWKLTFSPMLIEHQLASVEANTLRLWEFRTLVAGKLVNNTKKHKGPITSIAVNITNNWLFTNSDNGTIYKWDLSTGKKLGIFIKYVGLLPKIAISPDQKLLAICSNDKLHFLDLETMILREHVQDKLIPSITFSPNSKWLITSGVLLQCINSDTFKEDTIGLAKRYSEGTYSNVSFDKLGNLMAVATQCNLTLYEVGNSDSYLLKEQHIGRISIELGACSVALEPNGILLAVANSNGNIYIFKTRLWQLLSMNVRLAIEDEYSGTSQEYDREFKDLSENPIILQLPITEMEKGKVCIIFSPDGRFLASGGADKVLRIWDTQYWECVKTVNFFLNAIESIIWQTVTQGSLLIISDAGGEISCFSLKDNDDDLILHWTTYFRKILEITDANITHAKLDDTTTTLFNQRGAINKAKQKQKQKNSISIQNNEQLAVFSNSSVDLSVNSLIKAVINGNTELVKSLLSAGVPINEVVNKEGDTALFIAILHAKEEIALLLLSAKPNLDHKDIDGNTALHLAVKQQQKNIVRELLNQGAIINIPNKYGLSPLLIADHNSDLENMLMKAFTERRKASLQPECLIDQPAYKNTLFPVTSSEIALKLRKNSASMSILADNDYYELVKTAVSLNVHLKQSSNGNTALHWALVTRQATKILLLLREIEKIGKKSIRALQITNNEGVSVLELLDMMQDNLPQEAIDIVKRIFQYRPGYMSYREALIQEHKGKNLAKEIAIYDNLDINKLIHSAITGNVARLEDLLEAGVCVNATNTEGATALCSAALHGQIEIVKTLISYGADVNYPSKDNMTALFIAILNYKEEIALLLLDKEPNLNHQDLNGNTALHLAVIKKQTNVVNELLAHSPSLELVNNDGVSVVLAALRNSYLDGEFDITDMLLRVVRFKITTQEELEAKIISLLQTNEKKQDLDKSYLYDSNDQALFKLAMDRLSEINSFLLSVADRFIEQLLDESANVEALIDESYTMVVRISVSLRIHLQQSSNGNTALHWALITGQTEKIILLLKEIQRLGKEAVLALHIKNNDELTALELINEYIASFAEEATEIASITEHIMSYAATYTNEEKPHKAIDGNLKKKSKKHRKTKHQKSISITVAEELEQPADRELRFSVAPAEIARNQPDHISYEEVSSVSQSPDNDVEEIFQQKNKSRGNCCLTM